MQQKILPLVFTVISLGLFAQVTQRNILSKKYSPGDVKQSLISKSEWKPWPKTAVEWKAALPDSVGENIIANGEAALHYKFEPISATL